MSIDNITRKAQTGEPTTNGGHFGSKVNDAATAALPAPDSPEALMATVRGICTEAGYPTAMPGLYGVVFDRLDWSKEAVPGIVSGLTAEDVRNDYDNCVDESVTKLSDTIAQKIGDRVANPTIRDGAEEKISALCEEHGYGGVLPGLLDSALDRHGWDPRAIAAVLELDWEDISTIYATIVGPAADDIEEELAVRSCRLCGERSDNGEGSDGMCGNCADRNTCEHCGEHAEDGECQDSDCVESREDEDE